MVKPSSKLEQPEPRSVLRKLLHKPVVQQRALRKDSFLYALVDFLTSDSYMYGPLISQHEPRVEPASKKSPVPKTVDRSRGEASNLSSLQSPAAPSLDLFITNSSFFNSSPGTDPLTDLDEDSDVLKKNDDSARSLSATESLHLDDFVPLNKEEAEEVARCLVRKMGGRYSKELGIYVDFRDVEVEKWFLATTLLDPSNLESSKHIIKKLHNVGISKILDVLSVDKRQLEDLFNDSVHTPRVALRLRKVAGALQKHHRVGVCALKRIADYAELRRELQNLPGYSRTAAALFLRELRGVWPAANPEIDARTKAAARHLHLLSSSVVWNVSEVTPFIINLAGEVGLDVRDLELALFKLSVQHAHHYNQCIGGRECELLRNS